MKKCSHSTHHALAELNITPLLDLAFVLLVIFIITTTPIVNDLDVDLPSAAKRPKDQKPRVNYITVESSGKIYVNKDETTLASLHDAIVGLRLKDEVSSEGTNIDGVNIVIRGSAKTKYQNIVNVMDLVQQAGVGKVNLATEPFPDGNAKKE